MSDPRVFYTETIPAQFNRALEEQERAGEAGRRVLDDMRAVSATIRAEVEGEGGGTFFLNIERGRMRPGESPDHPPFLTLRQDRRAFERFAAEAGESALAMLGGLAGLARDMRLTQSRIANLRAVRGMLRFEVRGESGFVLHTHFGEGEPPAAPDTTVSVDAAAYADLRAGRLDPQGAFMNGQIQVEGDLQLAMQLALAAIAPD